MSKYNDYFSSISMSAEEIEMAEQAVALFEELYGPYRFETAFISDSESSNPSLWLFADDIIAEAKNLMSDEVSYSASVFAKRINCWELSKDNYTVNQEANVESKLAVKFTLNTGLETQLIATAANCNQLATVLERYIVPNLPE